MSERRTKYNSRRTRGYDSAAEARRADELKLLQMAGEISDLKEQVPFVLLEAFTGPDGKRIREIKYLADFTYTEKGRRIIEEVKGYMTDHARDKQKIFLYRFMRGMYSQQADEYRLNKV